MIHCGYIGLGNIGKPMCSNLVAGASEQGLSVSVYDVVAEPVAEMVALGARAADSPESIAKNCSLISICVRHDADVDQLLYGDDTRPGMLACAAPGTVLAIHSTVTRDSIRRWAVDAAQCDIHIVDAPISGGASGAADGSLCIMAGGEPDAVARCQPMFACTSKQVVYAGDVGNATVVKLANNLMNYAAFSAISEGTALLRAAGVELQALYDVGAANGVVSPMMKQFIDGRDGVRAACNDDDMRSIFGPFANLAEKDLDHALLLAQQLALNLPQTEVVRRHIEAVFMARPIAAG